MLNYQRVDLTKTDTPGHQAETGPEAVLGRKDRDAIWGNNATVVDPLKPVIFHNSLFC